MVYYLSVYNWSSFSLCQNICDNKILPFQQRKLDSMVSENCFRVLLIDEPRKKSV